MKVSRMNTKKKYQTPEMQIAVISNEGMFCESYGEDQGSWSGLSVMDVDESNPL